MKINNSKTFLRNVSVVAFGSLGAQVIGLLSTPFITRIYGPEIFGVLGLFVSIITILSPFSNLTYASAIVLPKSDSEAEQLFKLSKYLTVLTSLTIAIIILLSSEFLVKIEALYSLSNYLFYIPIALLFMGVFQSYEQKLIRTGEYVVLSLSTFMSALLTNILKIIIGLFLVSIKVLIIVTSINALLKLVIIKFTFREEAKVYHRSTKKNFKSVMRKYRDFPLYRFPQVFIDGISEGIPVILFTAWFGPISAGYYTLSRTVLNIPTGIVSKSIGDVFFPRLVKMDNNNKKISKEVLRFTFILLGLGFLFFSPVIFFGPGLFSFVFGNDWEDAGVVASFLAIWSLTRIMNIPTIKVMPIIKAQSFHLLFTITTLVVRFTGLIISNILYKDLVCSVLVFAILSGIANIILIIWTFLKVRNYDNNKSS